MSESTRAQSGDDLTSQEEVCAKSAKRRRSRLFRIIRAIVILYVIWLALLFIGQRWLIFPDWATPEPSSEEKYDNSTVVLTRDTGDGEQVIAWYIPCAAARRGTPSPLVVYLHGNAEIIDSQQYAIEMYRGMGCSVLLPEYRSYGRSGGKPSQDGIVDDANYFVEQALARADVDATRLVYHGRSFGGGVAAQLAAKRPPRVLILGSTFTSLADMAHRYLAPGFLLRNPFRTDRVLPTLDIPILIHHGDCDNIVPVEHGQALRELAEDVTYIELKGCSHNDFPGDGNDEQYQRDIRTFLSRNGIISD